MAKALTAAAIERLKPDPRKRREVPDGLLHGLYLVIQPNTGAKSWAVRYRFGGRPCKHTIGPYPAFDLGAARKEASEALQQVSRGSDPARVREERRRAEAAADDFETVACLWIERAQRPHNRSWAETARLIGLVPDQVDPKKLITKKGSLVAKWGNRKIGDIGRRDVIAVLDNIAAGAPVVANRTLAHLKTLFNWAVARDLIGISPCAGVEPPGDETSRDRMLDDGELRAVWKAAGELGRPFGSITQLLILTGQRREEVAGMEWTEIDLDNHLWRLPRGRVKNKNGHEVPLNEAAITIIKKLPRIKGCRYVFSTNGERPVSGFSKFKHKLDAKSGVKTWRLHDIRRTFASGLARLGINLPVIEKVLNHSSGSFKGIVGVYQKHGFADEKRAALETWGRYVTSLVEGKCAEVVNLAEVRKS
jgi:integrase